MLKLLDFGNITPDLAWKNLKMKKNTFLHKLKSFIDIGAFPKSALEYGIEFTPVDSAARAVIKILGATSDCNVFHIMNPSLVKISNLIDAANEFGCEITPMSDRLVSDVILGILADEERRHTISAISNDLDKSHEIVLTSPIMLVSDFTDDYLCELGLTWKKFDKGYIYKGLECFKKNRIY